jgi:ABC-type cobalt transport system, ATPase component
MLIKTQEVTYTYGEVDDNGIVIKGTSRLAVDKVSLEIAQGDFVAVCGHNGSGKSTLAKLFNALLIPSEGIVFVDGIDTKNEETVFDVRKSIGMVFQNPDNQIVATIVEDDVAFAPENLGIESGEIRRIVDGALESVGMSDYALRMPHKLSGGQKQRVAIAGILAMDPKCIVFDESTAMLDPKGRAEVMAAIRQLHESGKTVILVTHFMDEAVAADRIIVMNGGSVVADGTPREVFAQKEMLKSAGLEVPPLTQLMEQLKDAGLDVDTGALTLEECSESISQSLKI